jgi:hypothetical protein
LSVLPTLPPLFGAAGEGSVNLTKQALREMGRKSRSEELALKATDRLFGKALVRALAPKIENLCRGRFGSSQPPFRFVTEAAYGSVTAFVS